ncbi:MAG: RNA-binding S4 domain-containing protein [Lachnospiraceae bacterium]|nr:RNA-binding S4 domain-containing protein [Lachnospiraceae bacterium]
MEEIFIKDDYIKLDQAIKLAGLVMSGAEAKHLITEGEVLVNGEEELRRGKKLHDGDRFKLFDKEFVIRANQEG